MLFDGVAARYSTHMKVTIDLSAALGERLRREAERLGLTPEDLARAAVADLLATRDDDFETAAKRVLQKNQELYRRLA
jgi:predicted transcriptional regulator